jgi:hemerythrin superfamily protein
LLPKEVHVNAIDLLLADHEKVRKLLEQLDKTTERGIQTRQDLFKRVKDELTVHEIIEEEIFYPSLKQHPKAKEIVLEGYEEHNVVDMLMGELSDLPVDDETWGAKFTVMKENIEHHVEEEEGEMFAKARQVFSNAELDALGRAMEERRTEARREMAA